MESQAEDQVRRSTRASKGRPPARYTGEGQESTAELEGRSVSPTLSSVSSVSCASGSSAAKAKLLRAELVAKERVATLQDEARQERLEAAIRLEELRLAAEQAQILADAEETAARVNPCGTTDARPGETTASSEDLHVDEEDPMNRTQHKTRRRLRSTEKCRVLTDHARWSIDHAQTTCPMRTSLRKTTQAQAMH